MRQLKIAVTNKINYFYCVDKMSCWLKKATQYLVKCVVTVVSLKSEGFAFGKIYREVLFYYIITKISTCLNYLLYVYQSLWKKIRHYYHFIKITEL